MGGNGKSVFRIYTTNFGGAKKMAQKVTGAETTMDISADLEELGLPFGYIP